MNQPIKELCIITGVGPATGTELVRRFSERYRIAMLARDKTRLDSLSQQIPDSYAYTCDLTNKQQIGEVLAKISQQHGTPTIIIHNAVGHAFGNVMEIDPEAVETNFQINTIALLQLIQTLGPDMINAGKGALVVTGNTSAYRGKENFAAFAPTKAAQRILLESAARHLGPKGIHVAYVAIDAVIDTPMMRGMFPDETDEFFCQPKDIAEECFHIAHQPRSAWAFEVMIRPYIETW